MEKEVGPARPTRHRKCVRGGVRQPVRAEDVGAVYCAASVFRKGVRKTVEIAPGVVMPRIRALMLAGLPQSVSDVSVCPHRLAKRQFATGFIRSRTYTVQSTTSDV